MSLPKVLHSAFNTSLLVARSIRRRSVGFSTRFGILGLCLIVLSACSEGITAPVGGIDRAAVARVMPAVTDARLRITNGLGNVAIRQQVILDISNLEIALRSGNAERSQLLVRTVTREVTDYRAKASFSEGADMSAIFLMLQTVSQIVDAGNSVTP